MRPMLIRWKLERPRQGVRPLWKPQAELRCRRATSNDKEVVVAHLEMLGEGDKEDLLRPSGPVGIVGERPSGSVIDDAILGILGSAAGWRMRLLSCSM
jgi:hypothetical protein